MELPDLKALAHDTRATREASIALLIGSVVLLIFVFVPLRSDGPAIAAVTEALPTHPDAYENVVVDAKAAIVYDLSTGTVLYEKNADAQLPLASLTKLLTVVSALNELGPNVPVTITEADEAVDSPHRFVVGDVLTLSDLARLTLTASLNDGAAAIARTAAEREGTTTAAMLAAGADELGLTSTYAVNGSGLDVSPQVAGGYGSARDMAILAGDLATQNPEIALATTLPQADAQTASGKPYQILNTNPTVVHAPRLLLSKTGFTDLAGGNLALVFDAGFDHPIAVIILGSTEEARFTDGEALIAATLAHFADLASL